jgi:hypothetical protein
LLLAVWGRLRRPQQARDVVLVCGLLWLAWNGTRNVVWYGGVTMPILAAGLEQLRGAALPQERVGVRWPSGVLAAALIGLLVVVQPWFVREVGIGGRSLERALPPPAPALLDRSTPIVVAEYLRSHPGGRLFNDLAFGSYLIWALPHQPVFIDGRTEAFPSAVWEDYIAISYGQNAVGLLEHYGADRALLSRETQSGLSAALSASGRWEREYADDVAELWRRPG